MASTSIAVKILGDAKGFQKALGEAGGALSGFGKRIGKIGGAVALAGGAAIGAGVVKGVTSALDRADLQTSLANNLGLTAAQSEAAGAAAAAAYGEGFGASFEENANIAATLSGLGVKTTEALTEQTRQATAITETFAVDQAELLASTSALIERGFVANTAEAFDLLAESAKGSFIPLSEQLDLLNEYGDQIAQVGLTGEEAFGLISGAASSFEADKILDTFKELAIRGQDMSDTSVAALEGLGLNAEEVARAFGTGGDAAAVMRERVLESLYAIEDPIERNAAGVALMGTAFEDLGLNPLDKLTSDLEVSGDAAERLAESSLTVRDRFAALGRRGENALARLGQALLPFVEQAIPSLEAGLDRAIELFEKHMPTAIRVVQNVLRGLQPVFAAVLSVAVAIFEWFQRNWPAIQTVIVGTFQAVSDWVTTNWPPIRAVVLDVFQQIADWVSENWPAIQTVIVEVMETIGAIITEVVALVQAVWQRWGDEILLVVETVFRVLAPIIQNALNLVLAVIRTITALIRGDWDAVWDGIKAIVQNVMNLISSLVEASMELQRTYIELGLKAAKQLFGDIWNSIIRFLESLPGRMVRAFGKAGRILYNVGRDIMDGLWRGLKDVWKNVSGWLKDRTNLIPDLKGPLDKDRSLLVESGRAIMEGLWVGLDDGWDPVEDLLSGFGGRIRQAVPTSGFGAGLFDMLQTSFNADSATHPVSQSLVDFARDAYAKLSDNFKVWADLSVTVLDDITGQWRDATGEELARATGFQAAGPFDMAQVVGAMNTAQTVQAQAAAEAAERAEEAARRRAAAVLNQQRQRPTVAIEQIIVHDGRDLFDEIDRRAYLAGPR